MQPASEGKLTLVRATLQSETPVPGVELCPYVMCRRRDGSVTSDDIAKLAVQQAFAEHGSAGR